MGKQAGQTSGAKSRDVNGWPDVRGAMQSQSRRAAGSRNGRTTPYSSVSMDMEAGHIGAQQQPNTAVPIHSARDDEAKRMQHSCRSNAHARCLAKQVRSS